MILHGVNMVYKRPPYAPDAIGFGDDDAAFLAAEGFNTVRLGVIYKAVEPQPGSLRRRLPRPHRETRCARSPSTASSSLLDFHQDLYNERFQGEGWPDWAVQDDGLPPSRSRASPATTSPRRRCSAPSTTSGPTTRGPAAWASRTATPRHGATSPARFRDNAARARLRPAQRAVARHELAASASTRRAARPSTPTLLAFDERRIDAIRKVDAATLVFYEPQRPLQLRAADRTCRRSATRTPGFSFHDYCLDQTAPASCPTTEGLTFDNADQEAVKTDRALMLTEFGATDQHPRIQHIVDLADQHLVSWMWWAYCGCDDPTTSGPGDVQAIVMNPRKPPKGSNVIRKKLALLERPYPQVTAGTPTSIDYDSDSGAFSFRYSTKTPDGKVLPRRSKTTVYVPRRHYPNGYDAQAKGAAVVSKPGSQYLVLKRRDGVSSVKLTVSPSGK